METLVTSAEDSLLESLSYKLGNTSNYITNRRMVSFFPEGGNSYSPQMGTRVLKFRLSGDDFLDSSSVRLIFDIVNKGGDGVRPIGKAYAFFKRLRISCGGVVCEDLMLYNYIAHLIQITRSTNNVANDNAEGIALPFDIENAPATFVGISTDTSITCSLKLVSGIFNSNKYLPLAYMKGLEIELELADYTDPIITQITNSAGVTTANFGNIGTNYAIENAMIKCDIITLDSQLNNAFVSHLISGKSLKIPYSTYIANSQTVTTADVQINISRSLSSLQTIFVVFNKNLPLFTTDEIPVAVTTLNANTVTSRYKHYLKPWNTFYNPLTTNTLNTIAMNKDADIKNFQIMVNSKLYPERGIQSSGEAYHYLRQALKQEANDVHSMSISARDYRSNSFIIGVNMEKASVVSSFSGQNTKNSVITIKYTAPSEATRPDSMITILKCEQILEIMDSGCSVYD